MSYFLTVNDLKKIAKNAINVRNRCIFPFEGYQIKKRCLFIHIPKTAGTSLLKALGKKQRYGRRHIPYYVYQMADPSYYSNAFKFSFVRNPFDRCYSTYEYFVSGCDNTFPAECDIFKSFNDFEDFVLYGLGRGVLRNHPLFLPQSQYIVSAGGEIVVDFLGRYENINEDFLLLARKLALKENRLQKLNVNNSREFKDYRLAFRTSKAIDIVESLYKQDLLTLDYKFD